MSNTRSSRLRLRSDNGGNSTGQYSTQISKFFPKASTSTQPVESEPPNRRKRKAPIETVTSDALVKTVKVTPKNCSKRSKSSAPTTISKFFQSNEGNSSDDFETPRKPPPVAKAPPPKKAPTKKSTTRPTKGARKDSIVTKFFSNNGIDPEHLQMALALSRSVEQTSGPYEISEASMSTQEKREAVKNVFQKFGFKAPTSRDYNPNAWLGLSKNARKLKWAKRFTALTRRNTAIEVKKVNLKSQLVLQKFEDELSFGVSTNACASFQITSEHLSKFYMPNKTLFGLHGAVNEANVEEFYTNNLLEVSTAKCGCLLKDWRMIPGRDATPERPNVVKNNPKHFKVSGLNEKCDENEVKGGSDEKTWNNEEEEDGTGLDDVISIASSPADVVLLNPQVIEGLVENLTSKTLPQDRQNFRAYSPDMFNDSDDELLMDTTLLAPETPPQPIESSKFIEIAASSETITSNISIPKGNDSITIPSSSDTLTSNQPDDEMSDISEELPPPSQWRTQQDEEEERLLALYTKGLVDVDVDAEVEQFSEPQSARAPVPQAFGALEVSMIVNSTIPQMDLEEKAIYLSGSFVKQTQAGVMVFEEFTSDDEKTDEEPVSITRAPSSTPPQHKGQEQQPDQQPQTDIIEISDDSSPESSHIRSNASKRSSFEAFTESIDPLIAESFHSDDHLRAAVVTTKSSPIRKLSLQNVNEATQEIEFSFKSIDSYEENKGAGDAPNSQIDNNLSPADSFVISDDEINYSMKQSKWTSNTKHSSPFRASSFTFDDTQPSGSKDHATVNPCGSKDHAAADLEASRYIFDDEFYDDAFNLNKYDADAAIEMMERSIRDIVEKDFVTNARKSGTKLTRTKSDVPRGLHKHQTEGVSKFRSFLDDSFMVPKTNSIENDEIDEFDRLVHGNIVASRLNLSPSVKVKQMEVIPDRINLTASPETDRNTSNPKSEREFEVRNGEQVYHVKFGPNLTPKPNYEAMDTPERLIELRRFGLKALSKRKAIICLEHIFNRMHPFIEDRDIQYKGRPITTAIPKYLPDSPKEQLDSDSFDEFFHLEPLEVVHTNVPSQGNHSDNADEPLTQAIDVELGPLSTQPIGKTMNLNLGVSLPSNVLNHMFVPFVAEQTQYFLPSQPRKRCSWCLQPLHVAWYNLLRANPHLFEMILQYTPIDLNEIRSGFKALGLLYAVNDLIAFFDKHCITYRMENQRNKKKKV